MRASQHRIMLAGAGLFMLLSSSLSLLQVSTKWDAAAQHARKHQLPNAAAWPLANHAHMPANPLKAGELSTPVTEISPNPEQALRIVHGFDNMVLPPRSSFLLTLPNHKQLRFDNRSGEPMIIKSLVDQQLASLIFYKAH